MGKYGSFHGRTVEWLRSERSLRTATLPEHKLTEEPGQRARVRGHFALPSAAGRWAYAAFCALLLGLFLAMFNPGGVSRELRAEARRAGQTLEIGAVAGFAVAEFQRRRHRVAALVEIVDADAERAGALNAELAAEMAAELREAGPQGEAWIVSQGEPSSELLMAAAGVGVRCFVEGPSGFEERSAFAPGRAPDPGRRLPPSGGLRPAA